MPTTCTRGTLVPTCLNPTVPVVRVPEGIESERGSPMGILSFDGNVASGRTQSVVSERHHAHRALRARLVAELDGLGNTAADAARYLVVAGIRGTPLDPRDRAIARYLAAVVGADPEVAGTKMTGPRVVVSPTHRRYGASSSRCRRRRAHASPPSTASTTPSSSARKDLWHLAPVGRRAARCRSCSPPPVPCDAR